MELIIGAFFLGIILAIIGTVVMGILALVVKFQRKNLLKQVLSNNNIRNYTSSNQFADNSYLMIDHERDEFWVIIDDAIVRAYPNEIRGIKLEIDDTVVYKTSLTSATGRAVVGGVLFGGIGAVVGGVTAKKIGKKRVNKVSLTISFRNSNVPYLRLMLLDSQEGISTDDYRYKNAEEDGLYWSEYITSKIQ